MSPANTINVDLDKENDVLYVLRKSAPKQTINRDMIPGVVRRIHPKTGETVGLVIQNFSEKVPDMTATGDWALMEIFDLFFDMLNSGGKVPR
mgnify:CR=1 FL=1